MTRLSLPDSDLLTCGRVCRGEEPEEQLSGLIGSRGDRQETCVGLADVEIHVGYSAAIDDKFYN